MACSTHGPRFEHRDPGLMKYVNQLPTELKGATPGPRKQTSAGEGLIKIPVITETGESWEGRYAGVSSIVE